jgi:hypothetical protein
MSVVISTHFFKLSSLQVKGIDTYLAGSTSQMPKGDRKSVTLLLLVTRK